MRKVASATEMGTPEGMAASEANMGGQTPIPLVTPHANTQLSQDPKGCLNDLFKEKGEEAEEN